MVRTANHGTQSDVSPKTSQESPTGGLISWLLCAVLILGWFDYAPSSWELPGRPSFLWAGVGLFFAALLTLLNPFSRQQLQPALRRHRWVGVALLMFVIVQALSVPSAFSPWKAAAEVLRTSVVGVYLLLLWVWLPQCARLVGVLSMLGLGFVMLNIVLLIGAILSTELAEIVMMHEWHQNLGSLPRFCGWYDNPGGCGTQLLIAFALVQCCPDRKWRFWGTVAAVFIVCTTLSYATVVLGVASIAWVPFHRYTRVIVTVFMALAALFVLWFLPLRIEVFGTTLVDQKPHANWHQNGWGQIYHPVETLSIPGLEVNGHQTAYWQLFKRAGLCMLENSPVGVGGRNFAYHCPVKTMGTQGLWRERRHAHSFYGALMAEHGILGVLVFGLLFLAFLTGYTCRDELPGFRWVLMSLLVLGFGGGPWLQFATVAALACALERKGTGPGAPSTETHALSETDSLQS